MLTEQIEFVKDKTTKEPFEPQVDIATRIQETGLGSAYGISIYACNGTIDGTRGDHVLLAPAYNITREEVDFIVDTTARVIQEVFEKVNP